MDVKTAVAILSQQVLQLQNVVATIGQQAYETNKLLDQENNSIANPEQQVKSLMASMCIQMSALNSQAIIVQQAIDKISEILQNSAS